MFACYLPSVGLNRICTYLNQLFGSLEGTCVNYTNIFESHFLLFLK